MKNILKRLTTNLLLPLILAGAFFTWSFPRITSDYNFNTDELIYLDRSEYLDAYRSGDFSNPIWSQWGAYDQPQLTNYTYAQVGVDKTLLDNSASPCATQSDSFYDSWDCLAGLPLSLWPSGTSELQSLVVRARTLALAISSGVIALVYYLGLILGGPILGIFAAAFLGLFSFFRNLSTMAMMDQILLFFLTLQTIIAVRIVQKKSTKLIDYLALGVTTGLAMSTKFSALPPTAIIYALLLLSRINNWKQLAVSTALSIVVFFGLNPYLWINPVAKLQQMANWRLTQANNQKISDPASAIPNVDQAISYSIHELFSTWDHNSTLATPLLVIGVIGLISAISNKKTRFWGLASGLSVAALVMYLPLSWNRYLMPVIATVSLAIGMGISTILRYKPRQSHLYTALVGAIVLGLFTFAYNTLSTSEFAILVLTSLLAIQGALVSFSMLFGLTRDIIDKKLPSGSGQKLHKFSLILPVRNEPEVVGDTIKAMSRINYPHNKFEVLIPVRADDSPTLTAINNSLSQIKSDNFRIIPVDGDAFTKPYSLNIALHYASGDVVGVFDAEDEPQPELLSSINSKLNSEPDLAAIQAPVQLINLNSNWYSSLNAIEYYYWFRSVLPLLSRLGVTPLGGNTVFIRKQVLDDLGGWDETCLTEDAELGIRLSANNYHVGIITDTSLATLEETPSDEVGVVHQRSRWDQGYMQVLAKGDWNNLSGRQKLLAVYTLSQPIFRHLAFLNMIVTPFITMFIHVNPLITLISYLPSYFLLLQWGLYLLGLYDLSKLYKIKVSPFRYISTILFFYPYQALLSLGTFRAIGKTIVGNKAWDKTTHFNTHRLALAETN